MKGSIIFRFILIILTLCLLTITNSQAKNDLGVERNTINKPPDSIHGGEWTDDFWIGYLQNSEYIDVQVSHLFLKFLEQMHWTQTWTAHFTGGEFWHTEAISDSVRLAWNDAEQGFYTTGVYTSTVFDAGKAVDWASSAWRYSGNPDGLVLEFRTGNTPIPGDNWSEWKIPVMRIIEDYCAYTFNSDETECYSNMTGIDSNRFIQYRGRFTSNDPTKTTALYDIDFLYGIHCTRGQALSTVISPVDLREWANVIISSTTPVNTSLVIDLLAPDGAVLIHDVGNGTSLAGIDPREYPAVQLRASLATTDESISPDIDLWGVRWLVSNRIYLPILLR